MKKNSLLSIALASVLGASPIFAFQTQAFASSKLSDLKKEQQEVKEKNSAIDSKIDQKNGEISKIEGKQDNLRNEIERIDSDISDTDQKIREKEQKIEETKREVEKLKIEINVLKERIEERDQLLDQRARAMQTSGGSVNYLDVILGANSIGEFIDRVTAVTTLVNADQEIMNKQKKDQADLKNKQVTIEKQISSLQTLMEELKKVKEELNQQKGKQAALIKQLGEQKQKLENETLSLKEEQDILSAQEAAIKKAIKMEQSQLTSQRNNRVSSSNSSSGSGSGSGEVSSAPPISSGAFTSPTQGYVTSEFGNRSLDGFHSGMDIAKSGTVPIVAAADGVVLRSYLSSSYGNAIFITHSINGKVYTTVYAHMRSRVAGQGETVKKGQIIGYMGSTGNVTGQHLHFELHEGPWNQSKSNAVNPRKYVNF